MILDRKNFLCCGCSACRDVCPQKAIAMLEDQEGFLYPVVNHDKCIQCGLCEKTCPVINIQKKQSSQKAYAAYNIDEAIRLQSSSGGVFTLLAENILRQGGVVYGAAFNSSFEVQHVRITKREELEQLRGSKYVQSQCDGIYRSCLDDLAGGRKVLFTGTPCQVQALKSYLNNEWDNLLCMDIICHGVPSRAVWRRYLRHRATVAKSEITQIAFRLKDEGWKQYAVKFAFANSTAYCRGAGVDAYMQGFLGDLYLRPYCYVCGFKTKGRVSDITAADFWGVDKLYPDLDDDKGISLLIVHSPKGEAALHACIDKLFLQEVDLDRALKKNPSMIRPAKQKGDRREFFEKLRQGSTDIETIIRDNLNKHMSIRKRIKRFILSQFQIF